LLLISRLNGEETIMKRDLNNPIKTFMVLLFVIAITSIFGCAGNKNLRLGQQYVASGDWDNSIQAFQKALADDPEDQEIKILLIRSKKNASLDHLAKGEKYLEAKRYDEALTELQMAIAFDSTNLKAESLMKTAKAMKESDYYVKKGLAFEKAQNYSQAKESYLKALDLYKENDSAQQALDRYKKTEAGTRQKKYPLKLADQTPISLKFKGTPILNVFEVLTKLVGVNFIFDKDLKETKVTLFLTNVSFDQFMEIFLQTNQLDATVVNENTMIIYPGTAEKEKEYQDLQIRTFYLSNLDVKKAVELLTKILNSKDISANESQNALVIRGTKDKLDIASKILEANDRPSAEATFNVEILEVGRTKEKNLGIDLSPTSVSLSLGSAATDFFTPGSATAPASGGASLETIKKASNENLLLSIPTATLNLLKRDGDTKTLAKPQIRVKNGEEAKILIGERVPLRTNRRTDTTGAVTYDYQYQDIGVKLSVKPSINMHDEITMNLTLEVSSIGNNVGTAADPQYAINTRNAQSILTVRAGESVIIGGLIQDDERKSVQKIPLLGEIPVLGSLFSNYDTGDTQTDILMAITPIMVRSQEIPDQDVTQIWSGKEENISATQPYVGTQGNGADLMDRPKNDAVDELLMNQKDTSGNGTKAGTLGSPALNNNEGNKDKSNTDDPPEAIPQPVKVNKNTSNADIPEIEKKTEAVPVIAAVQPAPEKIVAIHEEKPAQAIQKTDSIMDTWPDTLPFTIQVNSFDKPEDAERRVESLKQLEYDSFTYEVRLAKENRTCHRVFVGRYKDHYSAQKACRELKQKGDFAGDIYVVNRSRAIGG
jgi:general secretion pathway protein D